MDPFALIVDGAFVEIRHLDSQPDDIPHKNVVWLPVVNEVVDNTSPNGVARATEERILEAGRYLIRTTLEDTPMSVLAAGMEVTPYQARIALHLSGLLPAVEAMMANQDTPAEATIAWEYAISFQRQSPFIASLGPALGLTEAQIDEMFLAASQVV